MEAISLPIFYMDAYFKICFHKFLGKCPKCEIDYNLEHHPNNFDCAGYKPFKILIVDVKEKERQNKSKHQ